MRLAAVKDGGQARLFVGPTHRLNDNVIVEKKGSALASLYRLVEWRPVR